MSSQRQSTEPGPAGRAPAAPAPPAVDLDQLEAAMANLPVPADIAELAKEKVEVDGGKVPPYGAEGR